jgi:putative heme iron utilization protein
MSEKQQAAAQAAREFFLSQKNGMLATLSLAVEGYPFGSITPYDVDLSGCPIIFISRISQHFKNLKADPRGSLLVLDAHGQHDPQAHTRATILGEFTPVEDSEQSSVEESYFKRFPESSSRSIAHDFEFFRCTPVRIRWIGGFGDIRWIDSRNYLDALHDQTAYESDAILAHMNEDHKDALVELLQHYAEIATSETSCELVGITSNGFWTAVRNDDKHKRVWLEFPSPAKSSAEVREAFISMLRICRS